jgi:hypothetical protein
MTWYDVFTPLLYRSRNRLYFSDSQTSLRRCFLAQVKNCQACGGKISHPEATGGTTGLYTAGRGDAALAGDLDLTFAAAVSGTVLAHGLVEKGGANGMLFTFLEGNCVDGAVSCTGTAPGAVCIVGGIGAGVRLDIGIGDEACKTSGDALFGDQAFGEAEGAETTNMGDMAL